jgi:hypothetical protein
MVTMVAEPLYDVIEVQPGDVYAVGQNVIKRSYSAVWRGSFGPNRATMSTSTMAAMPGAVPGPANQWPCLPRGVWVPSGNDIFFSGGAIRHSTNGMNFPS